MGIKSEVKGDQLILTVDISKAAMDAARPSKEGKMLMLDTTSGFTGIGPVRVNLMVGITNPNYVKAK